MSDIIILAIFYGSLIGGTIWFFRALGEGIKAWEEFYNE